MLQRGEAVSPEFGKSILERKREIRISRLYLVASRLCVGFVAKLRWLRLTNDLELQSRVLESIMGCCNDRTRRLDQSLN